MEQKPVRDRKKELELLQEIKFRSDPEPSKIISIKPRLDVVDTNYLEYMPRSKTDINEGLTKTQIDEKRRQGYVNVISGMTRQSWMDAFLCCAARSTKQDEYANVIRKHLSADSKVLRDGKVVKITREEIVPGDILVLSKGDKVNADALLVEISREEKEFAVKTFLYTETEDTYQKELIRSMGDPWERQELVLTGFEVVAGGGKAVVLAVGDQTAIGLIMKSFEDKMNKRSEI